MNTGYHVVAFYKDPQGPQPHPGCYNSAAFYSEARQGFTGNISEATAYSTWGQVLRAVYFNLGECVEQAGVPTPQRITGIPSNIPKAYVNGKLFCFLDGATAVNPVTLPEYQLTKEALDNDAPLPQGVCALNHGYFCSMPSNPQGLEEYRSARDAQGNQFYFYVGSVTQWGSNSPSIELCSIVNADFFKRRGCKDDQYLSDRLSEVFPTFDWAECGRGLFEVPEDIEDPNTYLSLLGFLQDEAFTDFCKQHDPFVG